MIFRRMDPLIIVVCVVGIVVGTLLGLFGYRLFRITLFVISFLVFAAISYGLLLLSDLQEWEDIMIACIIGVVLGLLCVILYHVAIFILGVLFGAAIGLIICAQIDWGNDPNAAEWAPYVIIGCLALICGLIFLWLQKFFIITGTSLVGAYGFVGGISELSSPDTSITRAVNAFLTGTWDTNVYGTTDTYIQLGAIALLALIFFFFQYLWSAKHCDHHEAQGVIIILTPNDRDGYKQIQE